MAVISLIFLILICLPLGYLLLLALASIRPSRPAPINDRTPTTHFIIAIPAHNEENVIENTIHNLLSSDYPSNLFKVHILADFCSDDTAALARRAGAIVHERNQGSRTGKGAALSYLFEQVLSDSWCEAIIVFDSDTKVDPNFLKIVDARLSCGDEVIQGQHVISNPREGWFPALTWAMFLIDNRIQNLGRSNLGWSAKNMGDSICFRADILRKVGWGQGLTDDYQLRQLLLLSNVKIKYEPGAIGYGEAPRSFAQAKAQRERWLRGTSDANKQSARLLFADWIKYRRGAILDGVLQTYLPSYSTITLLSSIFFIAQVLLNLFVSLLIPPALIISWAIVVIIAFCYPIMGLALERAPFRAYLVILTGPIFIIWRSWLAIRSRFGKKGITWIRTEHGAKV